MQLGIKINNKTRIKIMKIKLENIIALFAAVFLIAACVCVGTALDPAPWAFGQTDFLISVAAGPMIAIGGKNLTLTQAVAHRGQLLQERNKILDAPAETRGEGDAAEAVLSDEQRNRIVAIDEERTDLDTKIEEARERVRLDEEQRRLESEARSVDVRYVGDPAQGGMSRNERRDVARFSLGRALRLASEGRSVDQIDGVEGEMLQEGQVEARAAGITPHGNGFIVASVALSQGEQRDHSVGVAASGGNTVQTTVGTLLDALMEQLVFNRLGADVNTGLVGNLMVNRIVRGAAPTEKSENAAADEHNITFEPVTLTPRRLPTYVDISNQLFLQSQERNLERRITNHVTSELSIAMEISYIQNLLNTSGIGDVEGGTNGALPTFENIVNIAGALKNANVNPNAIRYLINTSVESYLMRAPLTVTSGGDPVADGKILPSGANRLAGRGFEISNVVPSDLDKGTSTGVCSAIIAGDFSGVSIGQWSGIEFLVDPFTQAVNGMRRVHAAVYHDSIVNDPAKISAMQDALTA